MGAIARSACGRASSATRGATGWAAAYRSLHGEAPDAASRYGSSLGYVAGTGLLLALVAGTVAGISVPTSGRYTPRPRVATATASAPVGPELQVTPAAFDVAPPRAAKAAPTPPADAAGNPRPYARRSSASEDELLAELRTAPQWGFNQTGAKSLYARLRNAEPHAGTVGAMCGPRALAAEMSCAGLPEQADMPWLMEPRCTASQSVALDLSIHSMSLRGKMGRPRSGPDTPERQAAQAGRLRSSLTGPSGDGRWRERGAVSTLVQVLQAEAQPSREVLIDALAAIPGPEATQALARRAVFDLSPACRERAVAALSRRPVTESRATLIAGLSYPWPPAADHAAEALAALGDRDALPGIARALDAPDPAEPFQDESGTWHKRELVAINHLSNCVVCHAPSASSSDMACAVVPVPGQPLRPVYYGSGGTGEGAIRFDVTYLRQDFSVVLSVAAPGRWPAEQRFDYLARTRRLTGYEVERLAGPPPARPNRHREAALFALRAIAGDSPEARPSE